MAAKRILELQVLLKAAGIKATTKQVEMLTASLQKMAGAEQKSTKATKTATKAKKEATAQTKKYNNETKRNQEGLAGRSGSEGKDFSRMAQGMGGLVQAYATIAANVFALSSAFLVLRNAADLSSMVKSAENFSDQFGISITRITKQMQEASGGALDFAEALPSINKAVSAGVGISDMEKLTVAATKASQTFGGSTAEALNRFISAAQRGRVEIIQTLGVVIKTEQAYKDYAAGIGKTALELTAADRQQAILNATIAESERIFKNIKIDPNPFTQFASTMVDLKDTILSTITDAITPFITAFNTSIPAALVVMGVILKSVGSRIFPVFESAVESARKKGIASSRAVTMAQIQGRQRRVKNLLEEQIQVKGLTEKQLRQRLKLYLSHHGEVLSASGAFSKKLFDKQGRVNKAALVQLKAFLGRAEALRAKGTVLKGSEQQSKQTIKNARALAAALGVEAKLFKAAAKDQANYNRAIANTVAWYTKLGRKADEVFGRIRVVTASAASAFKSGFALTFAGAQDGFSGFGKAIRDTGRSWKIFVRDMGRGSITIGKNFLNLGKLAGRTAGLLAGAFSVALGPIFTLLFYLGILKVAFDALAKKFDLTSYRVKQLKEGMDDFVESIKEIDNRTAKYIRQTKDSEASTQGLISKLEFIRGSIDSTANAFERLDDKMYETFNITLFDSINNIDALEQKLSNIKGGQFFDPKALLFSQKTSGIAGAIDAVTNAFFKTRDAVDETEKQIVGLDKATSMLLNKNVGGPLVDSFVQLNNFLQNSGLSGFSNQVVDNLGLAEDKAASLKLAITLGDKDTIFKIIQDSGKGLKFFQNMGAAAQEAAKQLVPLNKQITSLKTLQDVNGRINNFILGIDKLKNASVPNKEIVGFILDTKNALESLRDTGGPESLLKNLGDIDDKIFSSDQLEALKTTFGIDENTGVNAAITLLKKNFEPFKDLIDDSITATINLKKQQLLLTELKEKDLKNDTDRLKNLKDTHDVQETIRGIEYKSQDIKLRALKAERAIHIENKNTATERYIQLNLEINALDEQLEIRRRINDSITARNALEREIRPFELVTKSLQLVIQQNELAIERLEIEKELSFTAGQYLNISKDIYKNEKQNLILQKNVVQQQITILEKRLAAGKAVQNELDLERLKLDVLDAQLLALERQQRSRRASELENQGVSIFSKTGLREAADFFVDEINHQAKTLNSTFEILGKGFVKVVNDSFDKMVDTLLEGVWGHGGRDFGRAVLETLKAGLRDVIGQALKARIQESLAAIFGGNKKTLDQAQRETLITEIRKQIAATEENTRAIQNKPASKVVDTATDKLLDAKDGFKKTSSELIGQNTEEFNKIYESSEAALKVLEEHVDVSRDGFGQGIKAILSMFKIFGKGGIFPSLFRGKEKSQLEIDISKLEIPQIDLTGGLEKAIGEAAMAGSRNAEGINSLPKVIEENASKTVEAIQEVVNKPVEATTPKPDNITRDKHLAAINQELINIKSILSNKDTKTPLDTTPVVTAINTGAQGVKGSVDQTNTVVNSFTGLLQGIISALQFNTSELVRVVTGAVQQITQRCCAKENVKTPQDTRVLEKVEEVAPIINIDTDSVVQSTKTATDTINKSITDGNIKRSEFLTSFNDRAITTNENIKFNTQAIRDILLFLEMDASKRDYSAGAADLTDKVVTRLNPEQVTIKDAVKLKSDPQLKGINTGVMGNQETIETGNGILDVNARLLKTNNKETKDGFQNTISNLVTLVSLMGAQNSSSGLMDLINIGMQAFGATTGTPTPTGGTGAPVSALGGVAHRAELTWVGEGPNSEAVVPLPNNREIPVDLKGDTGGDTISIEQNFDFTNADSSAIPMLRAEARAIEDRTFNRVFTEINKGGRYAKVVGRR